MHKVREPQYFDRFRCIGAECEDTCCAGWGVLVDEETYERYQNPLLRVADKPLSSLIEINPARSGAGDYAKIRMDEQATCPALHQGLCSIQQTFTELYIPDLCSTYPRVLTMTGGALEKSLHLSCPEAARLVLNDPDAMIFHERMEEAPPRRPRSVAVIAGEPDDSLYAVRTLFAEVIRERSIPLWQRIVSIGFVMDKLAGVGTARAVPVLEDHLRNLRQGLFRELFASQRSDPAFQLETVLDLVVARIGSDYIGPRFLQCYSDFMRGLAWTADSSMEELAARCTLACRSYLQPFVRAHQHMLENYLVSYIFRTVFPYRRKLPDQKFAMDSGEESLRNAFFLLAVHYSIVRTLLTGMAALHQGLNAKQVVQLVQSYSKAFLHSTAFETAAVEYLGNNLKEPASGIAALVMD